MNFHKPANLAELYEILPGIEGKKYFLAGGTDINVQIKNDMIKNADIIYINHLNDLRGIKEEGEFIYLGALTSYSDILTSSLMKEKFPFLQKSLNNFASPLLTEMATIGGNIANGSPTADVTPLLLVENAILVLGSKKGDRQVKLCEYFTGYKQNVMQKNEIIKAVLLPKDGEKANYDTFYEKVGARKTLTIAKVAVAGMKLFENARFKEVKLAVGSLNEYPRRLTKIENYLHGQEQLTLDFAKIEELLAEEITPISDLRSDKEYRFQVCLNLIKSFLK